MGIRNIFSKKKKPTAEERRAFLLAHGRITDGVILDQKVDADGRDLIVFQYMLNGVDFESADELTPEQRSNIDNYVPGSKVGIRFDPKNQYDSIVE